MNILLNDRERNLYMKEIAELCWLCPETMSKKILRANVQQAFMLNTIKKMATKESDILCVGSFEDTACEGLIKLGYSITDIDPRTDIDLNAYFNNFPNAKYKCVFSTSVIEHVQDDELFIDQICKLLKPGGYGILTCDFNNDYKEGDNKPAEDYRLYTKHDLLTRLNKVLKENNCSLYGDIDYEAEPDFHYGSCIYSFATYVFKKHE